MLDSGGPTDRIYAEWWVRSPHVEAALAGNRPKIEGDASAVIIPDDIDAVRARSMDDYMKWRLRVREDFLRETALGRVARSFERDTESAQSRYLFAGDEEEFHFEAYNGVKTGSPESKPPSL